MVRMEQKPITIKQEYVDESGKYAVFSISPLMRGYGITMGTALRRALLSSVQGPAFTDVEIRTLQKKKGSNEPIVTQILHEFTSIPGVVETATELILNLRSLPIRIHSREPKRILIEGVGYKEVCGRDVIPDLEMEILDPEHYICTVEKGTIIKIEARCMLGRGYIPAEQHWPPHLRPEWAQLESFPPGVIPVDSDFSPVKKVAMNVEQIRVERFADYEKLTLEIWTNGSVDPQQALGEAADILWGYFHTVRGDYAPISELLGKPAIIPSSRAHLLPISTLNLPKRLHNKLTGMEIRTVGDLIDRRPSDLQKVKGMGKETISRVQMALAQFGLSMKKEKDEEDKEGLLSDESLKEMEPEPERRGKKAEKKAERREQGR